MLFAAVGQRGSDRTFAGKSQVSMPRSPATVAATPTAARKSNVSLNDLDPEPIHGPYRFQVKHETITSDLFDPSDQGLEIWYPDIAGKSKLRESTYKKWEGLSPISPKMIPHRLLHFNAYMNAQQKRRRVRGRLSRLHMPTKQLHRTFSFLLFLLMLYIILRSIYLYISLINK